MNDEKKSTYLKQLPRVCGEYAAVVLAVASLGEKHVVAVGRELIAFFVYATVKYRNEMSILFSYCSWRSLELTFAYVLRILHVRDGLVGQRPNSYAQLQI